MLKIKGKNIEITRGNMLPITVTADNDVNGNDYEFQIGDVIRFKIFDSKDVNKVYVQKDFTIEEVSTEKVIIITAKEMKIGELKNKPVEYWWEIDLNPDTDSEQTLIGCELNNGELNPAIITILPEGGNKTPEGGEA